jgi:hypothetical protein
MGSVSGEEHMKHPTLQKYFNWRQYTILTLTVGA